MKKIMYLIGGLAITSMAAGNTIACRLATDIIEEKVNLANIDTTLDNHLIIPVKGFTLHNLKQQAVTKLRSIDNFKNVRLDYDLEVNLFKSDSPSATNLITNTEEIKKGDDIYIEFIGTNDSKYVVPNSNSALIKFNIDEQIDLGHFKIPNLTINWFPNASGMIDYDYQIYHQCQNIIPYLPNNSFDIKYFVDENKTEIATPSQLKINQPIFIEITATEFSDVFIHGSKTGVLNCQVENNLFDLTTLKIQDNEIRYLKYAITIEDYNYNLIEKISPIIKDLAIDDLQINYYLTSDLKEPLNVNETKPNMNIYIQFCALKNAISIKPHTVSPAILIKLI